MERINIFRIVKTTEEILNSKEIKATLDFKEIYSLTKLNKKAAAINKRTTEREQDIRNAFAEAGKDINAEEKKELNKAFRKDLQDLFSEEVEFAVEVRLDPSRCEAMLRQLSGDGTEIAVDYLIEEIK